MVPWRFNVWLSIIGPWKIDATSWYIRLIYTFLFFNILYVTDYRYYTRHGMLLGRQHQHYPRIPRVTHYLCLTTCFHYLLPTVSAVFWHLSHVHIPLDFHRFTIKSLVQFHTLQSLHYMFFEPFNTHIVIARSSTSTIAAAWTNFGEGWKSCLTPR